jgi:lactoylglutathione lyase
MTATQVRGFFHVGVTVRDIDIALQFYEGALGLTVEQRDVRDGSIAAVAGLYPESVEVAFLAIPGSDVVVELVSYQGIERRSAACRPCDYGSGHLCLYVEDLDGLVQRLTTLGHPILGPIATIKLGPHKGSKAAYTVDPDGYPVELFERNP